MKKNVFKRILAGVLTVVMVFLMIPLGVLSVSAEDDYSVPTPSHKLLSSYNVLSGTDISSGDAQIVSSLDIFNRDKLSDLIKNNASYTNMHAQYGEAHEGKDMVSLAANIGVSLSYSVGTSIGIEKLFKASASQKFKFAASAEYNTEKEAYFYEYIVKVQKGYYSFNDASLDEVKDFSNKYLSEAFINALTGEDGTTPKEFFDRYGTHIITSYTAGGEAGVSLNSVQTQVGVSVDIEAAYANGAEGSATSLEGITAGINTALEIQGKLGVDVSAKNYESNAYTYAYGGDKAVAFNSSGSSTTFNYENWLNSLNNENSMILVDERLKLIPIWNLMPVSGNEERILELTSYFIKESEKQDSEFMEYFAIDESLFDYSKDWLNFENCKIITNEEELNNIRNDLNGVYVLANNIVLSEYANWTPIGTKEEPFRGRLYGNYNTISGLNISATVSDDPLHKTLVGLFGCNDGLITDLKINGDITMPDIRTDNVYVGAIAAYNEGIINNCYDGVNYHVAYEDYSKLNLPVRHVEQTNNATLVIGDEVGICLRGNYSNVKIEVADNHVHTPAYIVLDGATITGSIYSDNDRPIYIISKGTANSLSAPNNTIAVHAPHAKVSVFGDTELTILGGNATATGGNAPSAIVVSTLAVGGSLTLNVTGKNGCDGYNGWSNGDGTAGSAGGAGGNGGTAIQAETLIIKNATVNATGGSGGNGGYGGDGDNKVIGNKYQPGGNGGDGGHGADAIEMVTYSLDNAICNVTSGAGGRGGNGGSGGGSSSDYAGYGGNGGRGGNSGDVLVLDLSGRSVFTIGYAGNGGSGGYSANSDKNGGSYGSGTTGTATGFYNGHYYRLIKSSTSWESAKAACEALGGHLVTITSAEENEIVRTLAAGQSVWLGATDKETEGTWKWVTGEVFRENGTDLLYTNWLADQPDNNEANNDGAENYLHMSTSEDEGTWNDVYSTSNFYICEWDVSVYNDHYYRLIPSSASWESAKVACEVLGGHLVTITSAEENEVVRTLAAGQTVWLGATDKENEGTWKWVTGEVFRENGTDLLYTNWLATQPDNNEGNNDGAENYLDMRGEAGEWNDMYSYSFYYICEWDSYEEYSSAQFGEVEVPETAFNVLEGINCGINTDGKIRTLNSEVWDDMMLQIEAVTKTDYFDGDAFDPTTASVTLYGHLVSDYGKAIDFTCRGIVLSKMGYVKITYDAYVRYIPVHITKTVPAYIEIAKVGKSEFAKGEPFDISGLSVKVVYNNGEEKYISESDISHTVPSTEYADQTEEVIVTYEESGLSFSASYEIKTVTDSLERIFIDSPADRLIYQQGEELCLDGLQIYGIYKSGKKLLIDNSKLTFSVSPSLCTVGTSTVTIESQQNDDITATYTVTVKENKNFDHAWDEGRVTTEATHTSVGVVTYHCTVDNCDATKTETLPSLTGHVYGAWYKLNDTQHQRMCECGETITLDHDWNDGITVIPATHLTEGESLYTCSICAATETRVVEKTTTHTFNTWVKDNDEQHSHSCACGEVVYEDHNWDGGTVSVVPTYTTTGLMSYICNDCHAITTEIIPVLEIPDNAPYIVVDSKNAVIGNTVTVKISLQDNPGITSMRINVLYDSTRLTLTDVAYNTAMGGQCVMPENIQYLNGSVILYWADGFVNYEEDGVFATLTFDVSEEAVLDTTTTIAVTYQAEDIYDMAESNIMYFCEDGILTFVDYTPGDISGDGALNSKDTTRLMRYLAGWDVEINEAALDVNGDGIVNSKDTTRLMRYLAGWDVDIY